MIRMIQSTSAAQAKSYFNNALQKSDYYVNDQELSGSFHGRLAERLRLNKTVTKEKFSCLVENLHPATGNKLTQRNAKQRTVGYDINFHCPKSVSVLHVLSKDNHILDAFTQSVSDTMLAIEEDSQTRVRKNGRDENRSTGELLWAEFIHQTARPVKDVAPDPHLHCHCFTFNMTWDKTEQQFKAGQFRSIKRDMPFYQAMFHKRLADNLIKLGYRIKRTRKAFEIENVPQNAIDLFSKRTNEIGHYAKTNNITDKKELDALGARTRSKKQKGMTMNQLKNDWRKQIRELGMNGNEANGTIIRHPNVKDTLRLSSKQCVDHALQHSFERISVLQDRRILEIAYRHGLGSSSVSIANINKAFIKDKRIIHVKDNDLTFCTTHQVLEEEQRMVNLACQGKGKFQPFYNSTPSFKLNGEQAEAALAILTTKDQVSIIAGKAGTGKTTLMKETVRLIEETGKEVLTVAPTAQAARGVLKDEGFEQAETVAKLISDKSLQAKLKDGVLWVDEAGLLGVKDMAALIQIAVDNNARLILGGDTNQHASVARGDALRLLEVVAGLSTSKVSKIYRQKHKVYKMAVQAISGGDIKEGFKQLDSINSIKEIDKAKPAAMLVNDYMASMQKDKTALIVCPTHKQGELISNEIRKALKKAGKIGKADIDASCLVNLNLTEAEKNDIRNYAPGCILQFNQNSNGIKRGSRWVVESIKNNLLELTNKEKQSLQFPIERKKDFDIFQQTNLPLSKGDTVRITRNSFDAKQNRLNNGQELKVVGIDKKQLVRLQNTKSKAEYLLPKDFGHINYAYCMTSHASQGKTVDDVLIFQPSETFPATDMKQFYVSVSRGRNSVSIYTDDKQALFDQVMKPRSRMSAIELLKVSSKKITDDSPKNQKENKTMNKLTSPLYYPV